MKKFVSRVLYALASQPPTGQTPHASSVIYLIGDDMIFIRTIAGIMLLSTFTMLMLFWVA